MGYLLTYKWEYDLWPNPQVRQYQFTQLGKVRLGSSSPTQQNKAVYKHVWIDYYDFKVYYKSFMAVYD